MHVIVDARTVDARMTTAPLRAYLVDDEPLALERLTRLLAGFEEVTIAGTATDPAEALQFLSGGQARPSTYCFSTSRCRA